MNQDIDITNFNAGEWSPMMVGRFDEEKYYNACKTMRNMVVLPQGGATRRPGTMFVAKTQDQTNGERLIPFIFSVLQAYVAGFGNLYIRLYADNGLVESGGSPVVVVSPYPASVLAALAYAQSFDELFLTHVNYPPQALERTDAVSFAIAPMVFRDGPYEPMNTTPTTLTPSAATGNITLTASSTTGINGGTGFQPGDVGRFVRIRLVGIWAWTTITAVTSTTVVSATVQPTVPNGAFGQMDGAVWTPSTVYPDGYVCTGTSGNTYTASTGGTSADSGSGSGPSGTTANQTDGTVTWNVAAAVPAATTDWMISKWCVANGYPALVAFWQNRLVMSGSLEAPNVVEGSVTGDFTNFAPTQADGSVTDINAFSWLITDSEENTICWMSPAGSAQAMQLGIGTSGGEEIIQAASTAAALTPSNVQAYQETAYGGAQNVRAVRIGKSVLFFDRPGRKVHEWTFTWQVNGYLGPDLAVLAEHITRPVPSPPDALGIIQVAYQQNPYSVLWCVRSDGALVGMTYMRDDNIVGWHQHQLGGQYYGGPPRVESVAVIPSPQGGYDQLWLEVLRTINGVPTRFVEVMTPFFVGVSPDQAWFVDAALQNVLTYPNATVTPAGLTVSTDPDKPPSFGGFGTLAANASVFSSATVGSLIRTNGGKLVVTGYRTAELVAVQVLEPLTSLAPAIASAWSIGAPVSSVSGLDHLDGETVAILGDGQVSPRQVVASGSVALAAPATLVTAGLPYTPAIVGMPYAPQKAAAASFNGKIKRINTLWIRFFETIGGTFGIRQVDPLTYVETVKLEKISGRQANATMGQGTPLFTGQRRLPALGGYDREGQVMILQTEPLPITVLAISANADVEEVQ